jgi:5-methylcytosine-specific restriction endonuclease McrA
MRRSRVTEFCSRACFMANRRGKPGRAGEAHARWAGDAATHSGGYKRAIALFPIQPCEVCGATPEERRIHRHHRDQNPLNNVPENIAFLCPTHHSAEHRRLRAQEIAS